MPAKILTCSLADHISSDYHKEIRSFCDRCQSGKGRCLVECLLAISEEESEDAPLSRNAAD